MKAQPIQPLSIPTITHDQRTAVTAEFEQCAHEYQILAQSLERLTVREGELIDSLRTEKLQCAAPDRTPEGDRLEALAVASANTVPDFKTNKERLGVELVSIRRQITAIRRALPMAHERRTQAHKALGYLAATDHMPAYHAEVLKIERATTEIAQAYAALEELERELRIGLGLAEHPLRPVYLGLDPSLFPPLVNVALKALADKLVNIPIHAANLAKDTERKRRLPLAA